MRNWNWGQPIGGVIQVAFIVDDLQTAVSKYSAALNIGPWFVLEHFEFDWVKYRGQPSDLDVSIALGNSGNMTFELVQQHCGSPSVYNDTRQRRGYGFHHWAIGVEPDNYRSTIDRYLAQGFELALEAEVGVGGGAAYVDTETELGGMIEVIEVTPQVEQLFTLIRDANSNWDGRDPVRTLP